MLVVWAGVDILVAATRYVFIVIGGAVTAAEPVNPKNDMVILVNGLIRSNPVMW
jgi:hypothetical protein